MWLYVCIQNLKQIRIAGTIMSCDLELIIRYLPNFIFGIFLKEIR